MLGDAEAAPVGSDAGEAAITLSPLWIIVVLLVIIAILLLLVIVTIETQHAHARRMMAAMVVDMTRKLDELRSK